MKKTAYQIPEIRDENNHIIQNGAFGRKTAFVVTAITSYEATT